MTDLIDREKLIKTFKERHDYGLLVEIIESYVNAQPTYQPPTDSTTARERIDEHRVFAHKAINKVCNTCRNGELCGTCVIPNVADEINRMANDMSNSLDK